MGFLANLHENRHIAMMRV